MTPFSCSMSHFTALNRHGKLSVLGRVSPAAAPACHASTTEGTFYFHPSHRGVLGDRFALRFLTPKHTHTVHTHTHTCPRHHKGRMVSVWIDTELRMWTQKMAFFSLNAAMLPRVRKVAHKQLLVMLIASIHLHMRYTASPIFTARCL